MLPDAALAVGTGAALRRVPSMTCPLIVTSATLSACAWAKNAEYGTSTELSVAGARNRNAFQASRTRKMTSQIRPGPPAGGGVPGGLPGCCGRAAGSCS